MSRQTLELKLDKLTYGGDALGRLEDGRAVFVPYGLPGEQVRVRLVQEKKNYARAELLEVINPSQDRISAKCKHYGECGGCHYQHLSYNAQLKAKTEILRDQLQRIGKIENPPVNPMVACPNPWNYRSHMQFQLTGKGELGYVSADGSHIIPISECHLPALTINALWPRLEFGPEPVTSPDQIIEQVSLRLGSDDDLMLILESDGLEAPELELEAGISVIHRVAEDALVMAGEDHVFMEILKREFRVSAGSAIQANTVMAEKMVEHLLKKLPLPTETILNVYCGVGLFSAFLASECERLIGIEASPSASEDFTINLDEFDNVALYEARAEDVIPHLEMKQALVVVDPPRTGVDKHVLDSIRKLSPQLIAYVSCDPSTLARDSARLVAGGYQLMDVTPFDLYPQTYHIDSISIFELKS
ncbi:MAG: class I SAM-dependent RNA methyltransferase [Anaerolineae bacterium]|nr:class I SAM-dependent RNA methyltransferase [Anaerolineae bacterium]MDK1081143.1 class I SAM-dependent RNA methyltransferase [Anaerolineae bacterium]